MAILTISANIEMITLYAVVILVSTNELSFLTEIEKKFLLGIPSVILTVSVILNLICTL